MDIKEIEKMFLDMELGTSEQRSQYNKEPFTFQEDTSSNIAKELIFNHTIKCDDHA
jgi:hypothetical protein